MRWLIAVVALALCACASQSSPAPGQLSSSDLVQSAYKDCNQGGENLARYLDTGDPKSNDPTYGNERQRVLSLSGEQRALAIRQFADQYIQQCAQQEQQAEAAAAAAKAQADAQAQQQAQAEAQRQHQAQVQAKEQATCGKVGGKWGGLFGSSDKFCQMAYRSTGDGSTYYYSVSFDPEGNVVPSLGLPENASAEACATYGQKEGFRTTWHADTLICAI